MLEEEFVRMVVRKKSSSLFLLVYSNKVLLKENLCNEIENGLFVSFRLILL